MYLTVKTEKLTSTLVNYINIQKEGAKILISNYELMKITEHVCGEWNKGNKIRDTSPNNVA
jgi:hypothetical protein